MEKLAKELGIPAQPQGKATLEIAGGPLSSDSFLQFRRM